jgi:hypothetical protein
MYCLVRSRRFQRFLDSARMCHHRLFSSHNMVDFCRNQPDYLQLGDLSMETLNQVWASGYETQIIKYEARNAVILRVLTRFTTM